MAAPNPVPSRALLHALRGLVFTTSCSVVLLAEERRRRIKIAQGALDNARTLHTLRRRKSAALSRSTPLSGFHEPRPTDGEAAPEPSIRRRRRVPRQRTTPSPSPPSAAQQNSLLHHANALLPTPESTLRPPPVTQVLPRWFDNGVMSTLSNDAAGWRKDTTRQTPKSLFGAGPTSLDLARQTASREIHQPNVLGSGAVIQAVRNPARARAAAHDSEQWLAAAAKEVQDPSSTPRHVSNILGTATRILAFVPPRNATASIVNPDTTATNGAAAKGTLLRSVEVLIQAAASVDPERLPQFLILMQTRCDDYRRFLIHMTRRFRKATKRPALSHLLHFVARQGYLKDASFIDEVFRDTEKKDNYNRRKLQYEALKEAGLFAHYPKPAELELRESMLLHGLQARDWGFIEVEMKDAREHFRFGEESFNKAAATVLRDVQSGRLAAAYYRIRNTAKTTNSNLGQSHKFLDTVIEKMTQQHGIVLAEWFLRRFFDEYGVKMLFKWVYRVMAHHAGNRDERSASSWYTFCVEKCGVNFNPSFGQLRRSGGEHWGFSSASLDWLEQVLDNGQVGNSPKSAQSKNALGPEPYRHKEEYVAEYADGALFRNMSFLAKQEKWDDVCTALHNSDKRPRPYVSDRCFRLFIVACVQQDCGRFDRALSLVRGARQDGRGVNGAAMALMGGRLDAGVNPFDIVGDAMQLEIPIHDSMFNKGARTLINRGDLHGTVRMCELAAKQNGKGDLTYSAHIFSNVVHAYVGLYRYEELEKVAASILSTQQAWRQKSFCVKVLKWAIKVTSDRAVTDSRRMAGHLEANRLLVQVLGHIQKQTSAATMESQAARNKSLELDCKQEKPVPAAAWLGARSKEARSKTPRREAPIRSVAEDDLIDLSSIEVDRVHNHVHRHSDATIRRISMADEVQPARDAGEHLYGQVSYASAG